MQITNTYTIFSEFLNLRPGSNVYNLKKVLERWSKRIILNESYTFEDGIVGLGWLIAILNEKRYLEIDVNEVLEDIDDNLYQYTIKQVITGDLNVNNIKDLLLFHEQRLRSSGHQVNFYRHLTHVECIKLLLGRLNEYLIAKSSDLEIITIKIEILTLYSRLIRSSINEKLVEEAFYESVDHVIRSFEDLYFRKRLSELHIQIILKFLICVKQYNNPFWINKVKLIYEDLLSEYYSRLKGNEQNVIKTLDFIQNKFPCTSIERNASKWLFISLEGNRTLFWLSTNIHDFALTYEQA